MDFGIDIFTDATILISTYGPKETWSDFVNDATTDLFSISISDTQGTSSIPGLISRIKRGRYKNTVIFPYNFIVLLLSYNIIYHIITVPQRLINTQCGANYSPVGSSISLEGYIEPATVVSYRMHPNYFHSSDSSHSSKIKVKFPLHQES